MPAAERPAGSAVPRRVLGQYLRELRQQAGLTVKLAASLMEWSEPKLWRIETGQTAWFHAVVGTPMVKGSHAEVRAGQDAA